MSDRWARREVATTEWAPQTLAPDSLTDHDLKVLGELVQAELLEFRPVPAGYRLVFRSVAGVITLDRIRLTINPKFLVTGQQLISWMKYALDYKPASSEAPRRWTVSPSGVPDLICSALIQECRSLLRGGLRQDYRRTQQVDSVMRGRLDARAQVTRRFGMLDKLHLDTVQRDRHTWENLSCGVALRRAARVATTRAIRYEAGELAAEFPLQAGFDVAATRNRLRRADYHRMNDRYRRAHDWARALLGTGGPDDLLVDQGSAASALLVKTHRLWEKAVQRMIAEAAVAIHGASVHPTGPDGIRVQDRKTKTLPVDGLIKWCTADADRYLPIDAKYKDYRREIGRDDIHQLLTYAAAYSDGTMSRVVAVHPSEISTTNRSVTINGPNGSLGRIHIHGVAVDEAPAQGAEHLATLIRELSRG